MGVYGRLIRPGRIGEMSAIGFVLLLAAIDRRPTVAETPRWPRCSLSGGRWR